LDTCLLRRVEGALGMLAARALPVVGKVLEGDAVMLGGIIYVAADAAYLLARARLKGGLAHGDGRGRVAEVDHALVGEVLRPLRRVRGQVDRGVVCDVYPTRTSLSLRCVSCCR
jgi:hypothetical protein